VITHLFQNNCEDWAFEAKIFVGLEEGNPWINIFTEKALLK
jgi:hypothetical protein